MIETLQSRYGFTAMPFTAAIPVPALFGSAAHKEAVARLRWLISARGLGVITGEVGCGKTVAVRAAVDGQSSRPSLQTTEPRSRKIEASLRGRLRVMEGNAVDRSPAPAETAMTTDTEVGEEGAALGLVVAMPGFAATNRIAQVLGLVLPAVLGHQAHRAPSVPSGTASAQKSSFH